MKQKPLGLGLLPAKWMSDGEALSDIHREFGIRPTRFSGTKPFSLFAQHGEYVPGVSAMTGPLFPRDSKCRRATFMAKVSPGLGLNPNANTVTITPR
jgi:hypothetical protein